MSEKQDIIFEWLEADAETLQKLFPEDICMELQEVTSYIYAAEDRLEGRLIGAAAFSILEMLQRIVQLHYLVVEEAFQGQGIGSRLLENACSLIKEAGGDYILFRCIEDSSEKLLAPCHFARKNGFAPTAPETSLLVYPVERIRESKVYQKAQQSKPPSFLVAFTDYEDPRITAFNRDPAHGLLPLSQGTFHLQYSRFYLEKDRIRGSACVLLFQDGLAVLQDIFLEDGVDEKTIWPLLFSYAIGACGKEETLEKVCIRLSGRKRQTAVLGTLGEPEAEYKVMEMVRVL